MAQAMDTIEMDFQNALRQAEALEQAARELELLANGSLQECLRGVAANWKGENAVLFCKKGNIVRTNIGYAAESINHTAQVLRQMAQNIYEAEKRNYEIATERL